MKEQYKATVAYDGTAYQGWQDNTHAPSIEGTLRKTIEQIVQHPISLEAASRTDSGVHARGQVVTFTSNPLPTNKLHASLNRLLPQDISILSLETATQKFHPSLNAKEKIYIYTIHNSPIPSPFLRRSAWHIPQQLDLNKMRIAATHLIGTHDFRSFTSDTYDNYTRTITSIHIEHIDTTLTIRVTGTSFLYKMVRNIVGTLVEIGRGKRTDISYILASQSRIHAGVCAPPHGLELKAVLY